jgi:tetratricopeptide (TPR) repeat protein
MKTSSVLEAIEVPANPFPGLRPFEYNESHLFFGRDGQVDKMAARLRATRFLAVVGTSGSGKSSLVRAGLLPALRSGIVPGLGAQWRIAIMRPANAPIRKLSEELNAPDVFGSDDPENAALQRAITNATLWRGSRGLVESVIQNAMPSNEKLLVLVDQFEELFRFAREARKADDESFDNEAAAFVKLLLEAAGQRDVNIYVILTMRSDFLGDCSQFWDLPEAINQSQYLIPRLTRDQLREVITGPVALCNGRIATRLVNQLLNEIGDNQDQLPILQHSLMRTWEDWKEKRHEHGAAVEEIDLCCYEAIGGMANALSNHADEAFGELDKRHQDVAQKLFKSLTEKGEDNREIRRPVRLGEICEVADAGEDEVGRVIEVYRRPGRSFLMPPAGTALDSQTLIDISHESLIRVWKKLHRWVDEEAESAAIYRRLVEAARLRAGGLGGELWRGADLQSGTEWSTKNNPTETWARRYGGGFDGAMDFLNDSQAERQRERKEKEEQRLKEEEQLRKEKRQKLVRIGLALSVLVGVVMAGLLVLSILMYAQAEDERMIAENERTRAEKYGGDMSEIVNVLFESIYDDNDPDGTLKRLNQALEFYKQSDNVTGIGVTTANIGELYFRIGRYAEAENEYREALKLLELQSVLGPDHSYVVDIRSNLARALTDQKKYDEAGKLFTEIISTQKRNLGDGSPVIADTLTDQGVLYRDQDKFAEAEASFKQAVEIYKAALGEKHQQVAVALNFQAQLYVQQEKFDQAEPLLIQAQSILEENLGRADAAAARDKEVMLKSKYLYQILADIYADRAKIDSIKEQFDKAEPLFSRAVDIRRKLRDLNVPQAGNALSIDLYSLALSYHYQKKHPEAEKYYREAFEIQRKDPYLAEEAADTLESYADLLEETNRTAEAKRRRIEAAGLRGLTSR